MNVQSTSSARPTSTTPSATESTPSNDVSSTSGGNPEGAIDAAADVAKTAAVDIANDAFDSASDALPSVNKQLNNGAELAIDAPTFRFNAATQGLVPVNVEAQQQARLTSADQKAQAKLDATATGKLSPDGITDVEAQAKLSASHTGDAGTVNADIAASSTGDVEANLTAQGTTTDGRTSGSVDAHVDNASAQVQAEGHHEGKNGRVDVTFDGKSDKTFDLLVKGEGQTDDGRLSGKAELSADEKGAALKAEGHYDGDKVDVDVRVNADSHDGSASAAVDVDSQHLDASATLAHDKNGTSANVQAQLDTKNVSAELEAGIENTQVHGRGSVRAQSNDGSIGVQAELEVAGSTDGQTPTTVEGSASAYAGAGPFKAQVGIEASNFAPPKANAGLQWENPAGNVTLGANVGTNGSDVRGGAEVGVKF